MNRIRFSWDHQVALYQLVEQPTTKSTVPQEFSSAASWRRRSDGDLSDEMFDTVFEAVTELAGISLETMPDYQRAARDLIAKLAARTAQQASGRSASRK